MYMYACMHTYLHACRRQAGKNVEKKRATAIYVERKSEKKSVSKLCREKKRDVEKQSACQKKKEREHLPRQDYFILNENIIFIDRA